MAKRKRSSKRKRNYRRYLASDEWKVIRDRVLQRDNHICQDCDCKANQVHHLSYAPEVMAGEDDSKLVSLCGNCHQLRHPEKRKRQDAVIDYTALIFGDEPKTKTMRGQKVWMYCSVCQKRVKFKKRVADTRVIKCRKCKTQMLQGGNDG